jgi:hypothetical protein
VTKIHPLHDPRERVCVARLDDGWQLRQFAEDDPRRSYCATRGFMHVQLFHEERGVSVLTPSRLTRGHYQLASDGERYEARTWRTISEALAGLSLMSPSAPEMYAIESWFVHASEAPATRLLRMWWSGVWSAG